MDYGPVELVPDFEGLINAWVALFGNGENPMNAGLSKQYWSEDWSSGKSRRVFRQVTDELAQLVHDQRMSRSEVVDEWPRPEAS